MENRQRNEIYKTRSIGYKGEAMDSMAWATDLTIITKEKWRK
jgi:DNA mismatch repair ATPase MutL